jgi:hypothetical protein
MDIIFCKKLGSRRILIMSKQKKERDNVNGVGDSGTPMRGPGVY